MGQRLRILVVEDDAAVRETVRVSLESRGCDVVTADDGVEGLEAVRDGGFDAIVSDVRMPRRDGIWLWQETVRLRPELAGQFLFISGVPLNEDHGIEAERFLLKPFTMTQLWSEVSAIAAPPVP